MISLIAGILMAAGIVVFNLMHTKAGISTYVNMEGVVVVLGGTFAILIMTTRLEEMKHLIRLMRRLLVAQTTQKALKEKLKVSAKLLSEGRTPPQSDHPFLDRAVTWLSAGLSGEELDSLLFDGVRIEMERTHQIVGIVSNLAKYPPALGMVGTVFGIIAIFSGLNADGAQQMIGASLAVAMSATLYGLVLANFVLSPLGELLQQAADTEEAELTMIAETIRLLSEKRGSFYVEEKLELYDTA